MSQHDDPMIGRTLRGSIEIIRRIGEGGMGYVYEAYQPHLERRLAVKVMTPEHARNPVASEYFIREAKSASRLRHPNIIQIIDFGKEDDQTLFLAMEFLPGRPLTELLAEEFPLSAKRIIEIMRQTLSGLDEAHAHHIVHRDLKPDNLMVERTRGGKDFVKILDFGIAHLRDREAKAGPLTQQGAVLGTPHYMSPEQSRGDRVDARSDLFAMGIILYELLTGEVPFRGDSMPQVLVNIMSTEPLAPSSCRADLSIDPHLEAICLRALKKDVELRYQSARDFMAAFEDIKVSVRATPQVTDKFIFKRSKKLSGTRHKRPPPAAAPVRDTLESPPPPIQSLHEESTGHVVDVVDLFGSQEHEPSSPSEAVVLASEPAAAGVSAPQTPAQPLSSYAALGLDVEALRGDLLGERRHVTALTFHQRSHAQVDPEELLELHEHVHHHLTLALEQWQGVLQSRQGGFGVMLFGFEQPRSDDAFRAVQCALVLRKLVRRIAPGSIGFAFVITQGEVFAPQGDLSRVAGGALDLGSDAARQAGDDMVLAVGSELQDQLSVTFGLGPALKDGARPILGALDVEQVTASHAAEMVGRDRELASILGVLGRVGRGSGELLGITGEGGQGKSRLIHEAVKLAEPRNMLVLRARWRGEGAVALRASICAWLSDLLRQLARPREELLVALHELGVPAEYARLLDALMREKLHELVGTRGDVGVLESAANTGRAIEAAFRRAAQELSKERSLMLVLDEVGQSQDEVFSATLNRWSETLTTHNILLLTGVRTQPGVAHPDFPTGATVFHLDPLHESACYAYLRLMLPAHTPEMLCAKLVRLSAGSPLQLEQLALFLRDHASASMEEVEARLAEVRGIKQLMRMRVFGLPRAAQNLLGLLAVLGDGADMQEIFDLAAPHWEPEATLQGLYEEGVLEVEETDLSARLYFMPPALGQVIYRTMSKKARERTHARALHYIQEQLHAQQGQATRAQQEGMVRHLEALGRHEDASRVLTLLSGEAQRSFEHESAGEARAGQAAACAGVRWPGDVQGGAGCGAEVGP